MKGENDVSHHPAIAPNAPTTADPKTRPRSEEHPPPEDLLGGGDICSLEEEASTDDDKPLE